MKTKLPYNDSDPASIEAYAQKLLGISLRQALGNNIKQTYTGKGKLGQILEELYFKYKPNSNTEPDFPKAGVELKTTPIKKISKGLVSKERLVFNIINYEEEHKLTFKTSSFWKKNQLLLLMFYLYEQDKLDIDYIFKIIRLWEFPATDLKIIKDDWEKIVSKIRAGKAHEISEGDTLYLGACTKGAKAIKNKKQPFSKELADQRAFSLKSKYLNFIIEKGLANEKIIIDRKAYKKILEEKNIVREPQGSYKKISEELEPVVKNIEEYKKGETFEDVIIKRFTQYYGMSENELVRKLGIKKSDAKSRYYNIAKAIVGVKKGKIEEFEKADVVMKTIRLQTNGTPKESMSFAQIKYKEIIKEKWEDSYLYETFTKRFFFVIFQMESPKDKDPVLKKVMFWTMPAEDIEIARKFWKHTRDSVLNGDYEHFLKISDGSICHVRPKGINSKDLMETPQGTMEKKKCYWLNAEYIKGQLI